MEYIWVWSTGVLLLMVLFSFYLNFSGRKKLDVEKEKRIRAESKVSALEGNESHFRALASDALSKNSEVFLNLVSERFDKHQSTSQDELEKRKDAIENLVKPLNEKLGKFEEEISKIEEARNKAYGTITEQVKALSAGQIGLKSETQKLVQALRAPKTRGRWGEMQLKQVFEMAGLIENVNYELEKHLETDEGTKRPDAIVHIPGGKSIVIDAKTPLDAYLDALDSDTPSDQKGFIAKHAVQVRDHVKLLASKSYQAAIPTTPDFVVMFIPGETFVSAAAEVDTGLFEFAFERKILIATPTTLMALIKAIAYGWQQEKMAENALEVQTVAKELYDRLKTFGDHLGAVGKSLTKSVESYNKAVGSMDSRILPSVRKFETMGVVPAGRKIGNPKTVEISARGLTNVSDEE